MQSQRVFFSQKSRLQGSMGFTTYTGLHDWIYFDDRFQSDNSEIMICYKFLISHSLMRWENVNPLVYILIEYAYIY